MLTVPIVNSSVHSTKNIMEAFFKLSLQCQAYLYNYYYVIPSNVNLFWMWSRQEKDPWSCMAMFTFL